MQLMSNKNSPFKNGTIQEVFRAEIDSYIIQVGSDFYDNDGDYTFSSSQASKNYNIILKNILYSLANGNEKQKKAAARCLLNLHILPLRIH